MEFRVVERPARDTLGEGPVWDARTGSLLWVDILAPAVHRLNLATGEIATRMLAERVGWVMPRASRSDYIAGLKSGFATFDFDKDQLFHIGAPEADRPQNRLNDAKVDPAGRIWAGSKDDSDREASGALYRLDSDLRWERMDDGYRVTNGPAFSLDGTVLYHTDSAARTVYAFDLDTGGAISNKRVWLRFRDDWGYPDGMTTDAEGCIWIAHWDGGRISRFSPDAEHMGSIHLPASNITSCAFAGEDGSRMFVTSSTLGREAEPLAGALFEVYPKVAGLAPTPFAG